MSGRLFVGSVVLVTAGCAVAPAAPKDVVCTTQFVYGLSITVNDAVTAQPVCDAQVVVVSNNYRETLMTFPATGPCSYAGAGERAGVYDITASKAGYVTAAQTGVRVDANECHVIPVRVTLDLKREPPAGQKALDIRERLTRK